MTPNSRSYLNRFLSPDSIVPDAYNPIDWDRYAYVRNNPVNFNDPDGHCPRPSKEQGAVICISLFIKPSTIAAGPLTLHGDGRDFSSNSDPGASRGYIYIDPVNQTSDPHMNPSGYVFESRPVNLPCGDMCLYPPSDKNKWDVTYSDDGSITVTYDLVVSGPLDVGDVAPHINGTITLTPDGKGGYTYTMDRDGFPWAEGYYYDENGNVVTIFQDSAVRGDPYDLFAIEPNMPIQKQAGKFITGIGKGDPRKSIAQ